MAEKSSDTKKKKNWLESKMENNKLGHDNLHTD